MQFQFEKLFMEVKKEIKVKGFSKEEVMRVIGSYVPITVIEHMKKAQTLEEVFLCIKVFAVWYETDLIEELIEQFLLNSNSWKLLSEFKEELKRYFKGRFVPYNKDDKSKHSRADHYGESYTIVVDDAWDREVLHTECKKTCGKIASILEISGDVHGCFHGDHLHLDIASHA